MSSQKLTYEFETAARRIVAKESDVDWLTHALRFWIWPQEKWPHRERGKHVSELGMFAALAQMRHGRAEVVKALAEVTSAVETLASLMGDWTIRQYITDDALGPGFGEIDHPRLFMMLSDIVRRSKEAMLSRELLSESGRPKAGRGKALAPRQIDEKVACAATVMVAWSMVRDEPLGPQTRNAADAAEILFVLGSAPAGQYDKIKLRPLLGNDRIKAWRQHFEAAAHPNAALERLNRMCAEELSFMHRWHAGDPAARAFPSMLGVSPPKESP